jgi:hypothetical protein
MFDRLIREAAKAKSKATPIDSYETLHVEEFRDVPQIRAWARNEIPKMEFSCHR